MKLAAVLFTLLPLVFTESETFYFFVFLNKKDDKPVLPKEQVDKIMEGHMANIQRLAKEGKLIAAGPFEGGGGIFIFKAASLDQTKEWLSTDPGVKAQRWNIEILPYSPQGGKVCAAPEPIEMVSYDFIRFTNARESRDESKIVQDHEDYFRKAISPDNLVASGMFDHGGILILRGQWKKETIEQDPAVQTGAYLTEYKKLYIARGSFCEN